MPSSLPIATFVLGAILLLAAIFGSGTKLFGSELPTLSNAHRALAAILGAASLTATILLSVEPAATKSMRSTTSPEPAAPPRESEVAPATAEPAAIETDGQKDHKDAPPRASSGPEQADDQLKERRRFDPAKMDEYAYVIHVDWPTVDSCSVEPDKVLNDYLRPAYLATARATELVGLQKNVAEMSRRLYEYKSCVARIAGQKKATQAQDYAVYFDLAVRAEAETARADAIEMVVNSLIDSPLDEPSDN
jgi:hypothetical protein